MGSLRPYIPKAVIGQYLAQEEETMRQQITLPPASTNLTPKFSCQTAAGLPLVVGQLLLQVARIQIEANLANLGTHNLPG